MDKTTADNSNAVTHLQRGRIWQELPVGLTFHTGTRTVTETDLITFITWAGFTEPLFFDASAHDNGSTGRLVPAALTYSLAEGLVVQTHVFNGTGLAFLGMELKARKPVVVGDKLGATVRIIESRATKQPDRGLVVSTVSVYNSTGDEVLVYTPARLVSGHR